MGVPDSGVFKGFNQLLATAADQGFRQHMRVKDSVTLLQLRMAVICLALPALGLHGESRFPIYPQSWKPQSAGAWQHVQFKA